MSWERWGAATERALYGPGGFYHRPEGGPGHHYRTSSTASPYFARALVRLAGLVDEALGRPDAFDLVDVGAARGALLTAIDAVAAEEAPELAPRLRLTGVERAERPAYLPEGVGWVREPDGPLTGLLVANEWLDNVPCDVVERAGGVDRYVEVDPSGAERLGDPVDPDDAAWLARWWPLREDGDRAEVGRPRDAAWAAAVGWLERGVAVVIDYAHRREERVAGAFPTGTLTGYRAGRTVVPVPDGSCDLTAHVALDAVAAAAAPLAGETVLLDQRAALRELGVESRRPDRELAHADPRAYLAGLVRAGEEAELVARNGLGDFGWLLQARGVAVPLGPIG